LKESAMKNAIKTNLRPRHNENNVPIDAKAINKRVGALLTKSDMEQSARYVKTKLMFFTLQLIDLLYLIYK
jgi:hypothetical protein